MKIKTRFAPSPTGNIHIGNLRIAIINWMFAERKNGNFYLRIENTDKKRAEVKYICKIKEILRLMNINLKNKIILQTNNINKYIKAVNNFLIKRKAYYCICSKKEVLFWRNKFIKNKFISKWRALLPRKEKSFFVIRIKISIIFNAVFADEVLKKIEIKNIRINDEVVLRNKKSFSYNMCCAIDDYNMRISHLIRGNDHLTNTFLQIKIYSILNIKIPKLYHISLICETNATKLSKRSNIVNFNEMVDVKYLSETIFIYLVTLGLNIEKKCNNSLKKIKKKFASEKIKSKNIEFDLYKLNFFQKYYLSKKQKKEKYNKLLKKINIKFYHYNNIKKIAACIKKIKSSKTLHSKKYFVDKEYQILLEIQKRKNIFNYIIFSLETKNIFSLKKIEVYISYFSIKLRINRKAVFQMLRIILIGNSYSISICKIINILKQKEVVKRIQNIVLNYRANNGI